MSPPNTASGSHHRPASVTWLALLVFILALTHLLGLVDVIQRWDTYSSLSSMRSLWVLAALDGGWVIAWTVLGGGLWGCREWARRGVLVALLVQVTLEVGGTLLLVHSPYVRHRLPFSIGLGVVFMIVIAYRLTRSHIKRAFRNA